MRLMLSDDSHPDASDVGRVLLSLSEVLDDSMESLRLKGVGDGKSLMTLLLAYFANKTLFLQSFHF